MTPPATLLGTTAPAGVMGDLVAQAAHDLNNHLAAILGKAELGMFYDDPARTRQALASMLEVGAKARALVADLQRLMMWQREGDERVAIGDALALVSRMASRALDNAQVKLETAGAGALIARGTAAGLAQALWHIVHAAAKRHDPQSAATWQLTARLDEGNTAAEFEFHSPGSAWSPEERAAFLRSARLGEHTPTALGHAAMALRAAGATADVTSEAVRIRLPLR